MKSSERILEYLHKHPRASAPILSRATGTTVQNMRHHLLVLLKQGLIEEIPTPDTSQRGRPQKYYRLSEQGQTGNSLPLLHAILNVLLPGDDPAEPDWLTAAARSLAGVDLSGIRNTAQRLNRAVKRMSELGYQVRWEARPLRPQLYISYSPFNSLSAEHPSLENLDSHLVEVMTGYTLNKFSGGNVRRTEDAQIYSIQLD